MKLRSVARGIGLALILALVAPLGAICFAASPGHRMACCPADETTPMVRPCCAMDQDRTGLTVPAAAQAIGPLQPVGTFVPPVETRRFDRAAQNANASHPIAIRLLTSVILV